jgi:hypothetical protein
MKTRTKMIVRRVRKVSKHPVLFPINTYVSYALSVSSEQRIINSKKQRVYGVWADDTIWEELATVSETTSDRTNISVNTSTSTGKADMMQ